jgi:hypothetical protein
MDRGKEADERGKAVLDRIKSKLYPCTIGEWKVGGEDYKHKVERWNNSCALRSATYQRIINTPSHPSLPHSITKMSEITRNESESDKRESNMVKKSRFALPVIE